MPRDIEIYINGCSTAEVLAWATSIFGTFKHVEQIAWQWYHINEEMEGIINDLPPDVNALLEEYVNLAYHGKRAQKEGFNCEIERDYDAAVGNVEMIPQNIGRVFLNLLSNAFDAVHEKARSVDVLRSWSDFGLFPNPSPITPTKARHHHPSTRPNPR
jgi:hypothetical protein